MIGGLAYEKSGSSLAVTKPFESNLRHEGIGAESQQDDPQEVSSISDDSEVRESELEVSGTQRRRLTREQIALLEAEY